MLENILPQDVVPMMMTTQGMVPLGSTRPPPHAHNINMPNQNANSTPAAEGMEPSLAHLLRNLQRNRNNPNSEDANMFQVVMVSFVEQKIKADCLLSNRLYYFVIAKEFIIDWIFY